MKNENKKRAIEFLKELISHYELRELMPETSYVECEDLLPDLKELRSLIENWKEG
jgi:predicted RNA-binding protein with EMAP domain